MENCSRNVQDSGMLLQLFWSFFKIGGFTFGGGYAMIPLIEREITEKHHWMAKEEFLDMLTLAQASPGPISLNTAVFVGYKMKSYIGGMTALLGLILPPFAVILAVAAFFPMVQHNPWVEAAFRAMRPAVVALMFWPVVIWIRHLKPWGWAVMAVVAVSVWYLHWSPVWFLLSAATLAIGWTFYRARKGGLR